MTDVEIGTACIALSMRRLRNECTDRECVARSYQVIHRNSRRHMTVLDVVAVLRAVLPRTHVYSRDRLMWLRRRVEFAGVSEADAAHRVDDATPFDARRHVLHVPDASHLDLVPSGDRLLLGPTIRRGRARGVLVWWEE